jgi:hypothetical protein
VISLSPRTAVTSMCTCIYTAIYGEYDSLRQQPVQNLPTDFVCFTDTKGAPCPPWTVIRDQRLPDLHPRLRAKWHKTHPHLLFGTWPWHRSWQRVLKRYRYTIWIDANIQLTSSDFSRVITQSSMQNGWAMFAHPKRDCVYEELKASLPMLKYDQQPLLEQVEHYRRMGYPENAGLMAAGIIGRQTSRSDLAAVSEDWWREILRWSYQDQLSLPFVFWRRGLQWDVIPGSLRSNDLFRIEPHRSEA